MEDYEYFLKKVDDFHGGRCIGIALGTRMTLAAMRHLGLDPYRKGKDIIAYAEIDRCMTDAVLIITAHSGVDYELVARSASLVLDTRNAMSAYPGDNVVRL